MARYAGGDAGVTVKLDVSGPFFQGDPSKRFLENVRAMMQGVAEEGERAVRSIYPVGPTGHGKGGVIGRVKSLTNKPWYFTAVISETYIYPWPSGAPKEYRGGRTEARHHMFAQVTAQLRASRAVLSANLAKSMG